MDFRFKDNAGEADKSIFEQLGACISKEEAEIIECYRKADNQSRELVLKILSNQEK